MDQQIRFRLCSQVLSKQRFVDALACDNSGFDVPAGRRTGASEGEIDEIDDLAVVGFTGGFKEHRFPAYTALLLPIRRHLFEKALPRLLISAKALLKIFKDAQKISVRTQVVPCRILLEPWIVLIAQIDGAAQPMQRLAGVALNGKVAR